VILTPAELTVAGEFMSRAKGDGYRVVVVPHNVRGKLRNALDVTGSPIRDLDQYRQEWDASFQFTFVAVEDLTPAERAVYDRTEEILHLRGGWPKQVRTVAISETMRLLSGGFHCHVEGADCVVVIRHLLAKLHQATLAVMDPAQLEAVPAVGEAASPIPRHGRDGAPARRP
jgi:hypothetical protein